MSDPSLRWRATSPDPAAVEALQTAHRLDPLVATVLAARGWQPGPALTAFLAEPDEAAPDPLALYGVPAAAARLWDAVDRQELVTICGDYDADGVTSTALLVGVLRAAGARVDWFLPNRNVDGYGLNIAALDRLAAAGTRVIVTVDNGITSLPELAHARALGIDAIVTDHHLPGETLPEAFAIVNPRLMEDAGPFDPLAGVGVAYVLSRGLVASRDVAHLAATVESQRDLVTLGTLGDQAPLQGENRRLVKLGLAQLATRPRQGLATLARSVKVSLSGAGVAEVVAHRLIPRLNAAGRMARADLALELLLAPDEAIAKEISERLENLNRQRRQLTETTEVAALALVEGRPLGAAILLAQAGWHHGVMGIIASRLAERFDRPTIMFAREEEGWRGSGRSVPGFDLHAVLEKVGSQLGRFGGHAAAVGLTVGEAGLETLKTDIEALVAARREKDVIGHEEVRVDVELPLAALRPEAVAGLACLEPTGMGNPSPVLAARRLNVVRQERRGPGGPHLWLELADESPGGPRLEAIGFHMGARYPVAELLDVVFTPVVERRQGRTRLQLRLIALAASKDPTC